jgi:hypothetical protein
MTKPKTQGKKRAPYGIDQDGRPIKKGDTVIELIDGVPHIYTAGHDDGGHARTRRAKAATKRRIPARSR